MRFLTLLINLGLAALLSNCASSPEPVGHPVKWPTAKFATVKAYAYHCDAEEGREFVKPGGRLHVGILNPGPRELSPEQVERLISYITIPQAKSHRTPCYVPHHSFVFFDAQGRPVANFDVCFTCNKHQAFPAGAVEYPDMHRLYALVQELGLPTGTGKYFYRDLYVKQGGRRY